MKLAPDGHDWSDLAKKKKRKKLAAFYGKPVCV